MKCANCGAEIKVGCIYCSVCGKEAQIVSDYNLLEDDFLRNMLKEREEKIRGEAAGKTSAKETKEEGHSVKARTQEAPNNRRGQEESKNGRQKHRIKKRIIFAVSSIILLVVLIVAIVLMVGHSRENSYDYQLEQAKLCLEDKNYRAAEEFAVRALQLEKDSLETKLLLADIYVLRGEAGKAITLLNEVCDKYKDHQEAYQKLIDLYAEKKDYENIRELSEKTDDEDVLELFVEYFPRQPEFDRESGVYTEEFSVGISGGEGDRIYYTLDGSEPRQGKEYQGPILIEPGANIQIRAIARNEYELYSDEVKGEFQVELQKPEKPGVSPCGGSFYETQDITVTMPEGCKVYYTWDGTTPNTSSSQYTKPLTMPEGNNILSLIVVNEHGMSSDVKKCNYIYMPMTQSPMGPE